MSRQRKQSNDNKSSVRDRTSKRPNSCDKNERRQPRKDSKAKRVNLDNERISKYEKDYSNDPSWYSRNPELLKSAASLPFAQILGELMYPFTSTNSYSTSSVPGVMAIGYTHSYGGDGAYPTALNQAGRSIYSYLVHANSRNYSYEYQDLMIAIAAGANVFAMLANAIRAYGVAKTYSERNRYLPDTILQACGFKPESVRDNLGKMWFDINELISRTTQIWIPNTIPVLQRWFWMATNVYKDANDPKGQIYVYVPHNFHVYNATLLDTGGGLERLMVNGSMFNPFDFAYSWETWYQAISTAIDKLLEDEDRGIMYGDILRAYTSSGIYALPQVPSDYRVEPVYSAEVLTQIENCTLASPCYGLAQDTNGLSPVWHQAIAGTAPAGVWQWNSETANKYLSPLQPVINFHFADQPTPDSLSVATRLTSVGTELVVGFGVNSSTGTITPNVGVQKPMACGTEVVMGIQIYHMELESNVPTLKSDKLMYPVIAESAERHSWTDVEMSLMAFDWHPFLYLLKQAGSTERQAADVVRAYGDYDNYLISNFPEMRKLHAACVYSLWGMPHMGYSKKSDLD